MAWSWARRAFICSTERSEYPSGVSEESPARDIAHARVDQLVCSFTGSDSKCYSKHMKKETPERYLANAKETLAKAGIEDNRYVDIKYVKSACGIAYRGVLKAIDDYLLKHGAEEDKLPRKIEEYRKALKEYSVHNGKLFDQFNDLYHELHIAGYYHGDLRHVNLVKPAMQNAKDFVRKLS